MKIFYIRWLFLMVCLVLFSSVQAYEERPALHALVIGNNDYPMVPLRNSINDANAISEQLEEQGFIVTTLLNANGAALQ